MENNTMIISDNKGIDWIQNKSKGPCPEASEFFNIDTARLARKFHSQIPGYKATSLRALPELAHMTGIEGIYVKDESQRLHLNSFKVMGGSFALFRFIQKRLGLKDDEMNFKYLTSKECHDKLGTLTFASATDGNHGRGIAWAASQLGHNCIIYVHKDTSKARIDAIRSYGAVVKIVNGNYDDAVRQVAKDAKEFGWYIISDTSWDGYTEVPTWIMQGYTTMLVEAQEQFSGMGIYRPTHVFVQAGVGALAASVIGFYSALFKDNPPIFCVVEPDKAPCIYESAKANDGKPHTVKGDLDTIMAGLACGDPSPIAWNILSKCADVFIQVPDYVAARGMRIYSCPLHGDPFIISGESGAVTLGALYSILTEEDNADLKAALKLDSNSKVLLINTEGNTDPVHFRQIIWDGSNPVPHKYFTQR
jgi:diaminopropionate ammonia-lyase family